MDSACFSFELLPEKRPVRLPDLKFKHQIMVNFTNHWRI